MKEIGPPSAEDSLPARERGTSELGYLPTIKHADTMMRMSKTDQLTERLRQAILNCGESRYSLAQKTGVEQSVLSRFMSGETSLRLDTAGRLCEALGLELTPNRKANKSSKGKAEK